MLPDPAPLDFLTPRQRLIVELVGCPNTDAAEIEELMRDKRPNLTDLSAEQFTILARSAYRRLPAMRRFFSLQTFWFNV